MELKKYSTCCWIDFENKIFVAGGIWYLPTDIQKEHPPLPMSQNIDCATFILTEYPYIEP
jgi:hypothetical protein